MFHKVQQQEQLLGHYPLRVTQIHRTLPTVLGNREAKKLLLLLVQHLEQEEPGQDCYQHSMRNELNKQEVQLSLHSNIWSPMVN